MRRSGKIKLAVAIVLGVCFLALFIVSAYKVITDTVKAKHEDDAFQDLIDQLGEYDRQENKPGDTVTTPNVPDNDPDSPPDDTTNDNNGTTPPDSSTGQDPVENNEPEKFDRYDALHESNPDLFGWIEIEGTKVNYPVMHTPKNPQYYLRRNFEGKKATSGVPFLDAKCYENCGNYIVYGHNMKNGTMFHTLMSYAKKSFYKEHPIIWFDTLDKPGEYQIIAVFYSQVYSVYDEDVFRFYNYTDLTDEERFNEYISEVHKAQIYDTGFTAEYGDQLLTLITCSYHTTNGRLVVVAKEIKPESGTENGAASQTTSETASPVEG